MSDPILPEQSQTDQPFETTFRFDWTTPPLTANQRMHRMKRARITSDVRGVGKWFAWRLPHFQRIEVTLTWIVKDKRRRDVDNIVPTLKALCDGLVDAGVVDDDTPAFMDKRMPVIVLDQTQTPHLELTVKAVA